MLLPRCRRFSPAFTLMEVLVSMTVLVLLVGMVVAMVSGVSRSTTASRRQLAADNEARRVFDRMASDFGRMVKRVDADNVFASVKGTDGANDKMFFYGDAPAYYDTAGVAASATGLIGYRIHDEAAAGGVADLQLERLGKGLTWDVTTPGTVVFLTYPAAAPPPAATPTPFPASTFAGTFTAPSTWSGGGVWATTIGTGTNKFDDGTDTSYHTLSSDVFRLEYCFVLKTPAANGALYTTSLAQGQGFDNVSAIIVGLALLDAQGRALLPANVSMNTLVAALADPDLTTAPPTKLMAEIWAAKLNTAGLAASLGVPQAVVSQIRVYQRTFYLNTRLNLNTP